jgi:hypothetical protein
MILNMFQLIDSKKRLVPIVELKYDVVTIHYKESMSSIATSDNGD